MRPGAQDQAARQAPGARRHCADRPPRHRPCVSRGADRRRRRRGVELQALLGRVLSEPRAPAAGGGRGVLVDLPDDSLFDAVSDGQPLLLRASQPARPDGRGGAVQGSAARARRAARPAAGHRRDRGAPARGRRGARTLRPQHDRAHARGARAAHRAHPAAALSDRLPRPLDAGRRPRGGPSARPPRAAGIRPRHASGDRRGRRRRGGGARGGAHARHDRRRHGLRGRDALRCGAELVVHSYPDGRAPGASAWSSSGCPSSWSRRPAPAAMSPC